MIQIGKNFYKGYSKMHNPGNVADRLEVILIEIKRDCEDGGYELVTLSHSSYLFNNNNGMFEVSVLAEFKKK
jgi:hypothetical protein